MLVTALSVLLGPRNLGLRSMSDFDHRMHIIFQNLFTIVWWNVLIQYLIKFTASYKNTR